MKKLLLYVFLAFLLSRPAGAEVTIALVDTAQAFDAYYKTQIMATRLAGERNRFEKEVAAEEDEYAAEMRDAQELERRAQDTTAPLDARHDSDAALAAKMQDIKSLDTTIEQMRKSRTDEMKEDLSRSHEEISDEIQRVILAYVANKGYDLVLDKSATMGDVTTILPYCTAHIVDLTPQIIAQLNASAPIAAPMKNH